MVKNPPSNAGDVGSMPGGGTKIPHAVGQLSPCATTTEPHATTRESLRATTKSPCTAMRDPACCKEDPVCRN